MNNYIKTRNKLMLEAKAALDAGDLKTAQEKRAAIEALDAEKEAHDKETANINALQNMNVSAPLTLENKSVHVEGERAATTPETTDVTPQNREIEAFQNYLLGREYDHDALRVEPRDTANLASSNAVVIPETVRDQIWTEMGELHPILAALRMTFVPGDLTIIKETAGGDNAAWYDESTTVTDGTFTLGSLELKGYELAKAVPISWKLRKMSISAFMTYVISLIAEKMGNALAAAVMNGDGVPGQGDTFKAQPTGIIKTLEAESSTPQVLTWTASSDEVDYDKICDLFALVKSGYLAGSAIYAKAAFIWGTLAKLKDTTGRPLFIPDVTAGGIGRLLGAQVFEEDAAPANAMLLGNIAQGYVANCNENVTLYQEDHVKARYTDYMGYALIDGKVLTTKAFAYLKKSA